MKGETKRKASDAKLRTSLASHNTRTQYKLTSSIIHFCILYCNNFLHCVVKGLGVLAQCAKPLVSFMGCIHDAKVRAINYSQS